MKNINQKALVEGSYEEWQSGCSDGGRRRGRLLLLNATVFLCWRQATRGGMWQTWSKARSRLNVAISLVSYLSGTHLPGFSEASDAQVSHPSKHCSSWIRSGLRWPSLRRNLPDAAFVSTIKPYQMVWEGRSLLLCDAQHLQRGKWIMKRSCRQTNMRHLSEWSMRGRAKNEERRTKPWRHYWAVVGRVV